MEFKTLKKVLAYLVSVHTWYKYIYMFTQVEPAGCSHWWNLLTGETQKQGFFKKGRTVHTGGTCCVHTGGTCGLFFRQIKSIKRAFEYPKQHQGSSGYTVLCFPQEIKRIDGISDVLNLSRLDNSSFQYSTNYVQKLNTLRGLI